MFRKQYDVIVCGGGIAGCAAALAAARRGMKTALIEKTIIPGGLATGGLVLVYLPLCDGRGNQVTFGIADELLRAANKYGPADIPADWRKPDGSRLEVYFSPASLILSLDELLLAAGVDFWLDTRITGVNVDGRRVTAILAANKSGSGELRARVFVDATGDADVAHFAGNDCLTASNSMVSWFVEHREAKDSSRYVFGDKVSTNIMSEGIGRAYTRPGIDGRMVSDFVLTGREKYRRELDKDYTAGTESRKSRYPLMVPVVPPLRHCRCIRGRHILQPGRENSGCDDSVGLASDWRCRGKIWEIPYSSMLPDNLSGIIAAGRCTSALDDAWEITRVIPVAAMTGEVAGVAAALAAGSGVTPEELPYERLAVELRERCGFPLKIAEVTEPAMPVGV